MQDIISILEAKNGKFVSGEKLKLKSEEIEKILNESGFKWEYNQRKGYRITESRAVFRSELLKNYLHNSDRYTLFVLDSVDSTNNFLKKKYKDGANEYTLAVAETQSAGRGRMNRRFISPENGIYFSLLFTPSKSASNTKAADTVNITAAAAVAVTDAIKKVTGLRASIKWVNDVFLEGKKICGILTESSLSSDGGSFDYVIVGIGVNLVADFSGTEVENIAGGIYGKNSVPPDICKIKNRLTAEIVNNLVRLCPGGTVRKTKPFVKKYRSKLFIIGKNVTVLRGSEEYEAKVTGLSDDLSLITERKNGEKEILYSGEVRIKL